LGGIDRLAADFRELAERAARRALRVGYEALAWGRHINDYRDSWEVVRRADHKAVGLVLDNFHIQARSADLSALRAIPGDRISFVQIADAPKLQMDYLSWARHWRCLPGQGDFDLAGFMDALETTGYDGWLSLEIFNDRFRAGSPRSVAVDGRRSLIWLMDEASRKAGRPIPGAAPMPPPAQVSNVEFIEFAVSENERAGFELLLRAMGFSRTGQHRSKQVALWTQGAIRLVVNSEPAGFAHAYQVTHGVSVCAVTLKVADAAATMQRAQALLETPHHESVGPGELDIPAVRGLGGSLLYFVDEASPLARWSQVDFIAAGESEAGAGLERIDHVSQTMHYEEMLTWLLFYVSLLETRKTPSQAVLDPGGVVQSQVIESGLPHPAGGLRLVLNGSQSRRTQSARFVSESFGCGVQHIALTTGDITATVKQLKAAGVAMLAIPDNYYDDLEARTDLSADEIAALKSLGILYDRDEAGVFHQAYTAALPSGFFFEIVQRNGYGGYGAPNAGIRLAAQARAAHLPTMPKM
jgi:4-hydroxyphenylpyruvate dioxygenase